jgi:predicted restriction endonuclease
VEKLLAEGECRVNGCSKDADDPAHIAPRSLGGRDNRHATIPLCREHHRRLDLDRNFDLGKHLTYAEQAECVLVLGLHSAHRRLFPTEHPKEGRIWK